MVKITNITYFLPQIVFREDFGTVGRGGYFDEYGIIRDIIQNHLLQVLCLVAMEKPISLDLEHIRDEKVKIKSKGEMNLLYFCNLLRPSIYMKLTVKQPGLEMFTVQSELDLSYRQRYQGIAIPEAHERLILDTIRGDHQHFVRRDELKEVLSYNVFQLNLVDDYSGCVGDFYATLSPYR